MIIWYDNRIEIYVEHFKLSLSACEFISSRSNHKKLNDSQVLTVDSRLFELIGTGNSSDNEKFR